MSDQTTSEYVAEFRARCEAIGLPCDDAVVIGHLYAKMAMYRRLWMALLDRPENGVKPANTAV